MREFSENPAMTKNMALALENIAIATGLLAYAHSASKTLDHRMLDLNKNLKTSVKEFADLVKELGDANFSQEVDGLMHFFEGAHIDNTHVSWKAEEGVGTVTIHGIHKGHTAFSVTLHFGEKSGEKKPPTEKDQSKEIKKTEEKEQTKSGSAPMFKLGPDAMHSEGRYDPKGEQPIFKPKVIWSPISKYNLWKQQQRPGP